MKQPLHILAEGPSEERFIRLVLQPHMLASGRFTSFSSVTTSRDASRGKFSGGAVPFPRFQKEVQNLLRRPDLLVTTMLDLFRLPESFPGVATASAKSGARRAEAIEQALAESIGSDRFMPYLQVHEFEALLFADVEAIEQVLKTKYAQRTKGPEQLRSLATTFSCPEDINGQLPPSYRLKQLFPGYGKTSDGPLVFQRIPLATVRQACPHFHQWLNRIEQLP